MKFPFGQHEGEEISDIPDNYLLWAVTNITDREHPNYSIGQLKYYIKKELKKRTQALDPFKQTPVYKNSNS